MTMESIVDKSFSMCFSLVAFAIFQPIAIMRAALVLFPNYFDSFATTLSTLDPALDTRGFFELWRFIIILGILSRIYSVLDIPSVEVIDSIGTFATTNDDFMRVRI